MAAIKAALNKKVDADDKIDLEKTAAFKIPDAQEKTGEPKSQPVRQQTAIWRWLTNSCVICSNDCAGHKCRMKVFR